MKPISENTSFQSPGISKPIRLLEDTEISDVVIKIAWDKQITGKFTVVVNYYNDDKPSIVMTYSHQNTSAASLLLFLDRQQANKKNGFVLKSAKVECKIMRKIDNQVVPFDINVSISKFEGSEKENHWLLLESKLPKPDNFPEVGVI